MTTVWEERGEVLQSLIPFLRIQNTADVSTRASSRKTAITTKAQWRADEGWGGGKAGTNYRGPGVRRKGPGPKCVAYAFEFLGNIIICRL